MKKLILIIFLLIATVGCSSSQEQTPSAEDLVGNYTLNYFYVPACNSCEDFIAYGIPVIEEVFQDHITINKYDLDASGTKVIYDDIINRLDGFDQENYGFGPFISFGDYFAKLGYAYGDESELVNDMLKAVNGMELGDELIAGRYYFK